LEYFKDGGSRTYSLYDLNTGLETSSKTRTELENISLDVIYHKNFNNAENLSVFSLVGISLVEFNATEEFVINDVNYGSAKDSGRSLGFNLGVGAKYFFIPDILSFHTKIKYTHIKDLKLKNITGINEVNSITSISFGLIRYF
jgi:hypothetical protein